MHLHLVERHQPGAAYDDGHVIALTPAACSDLDREGVPYRIPEDVAAWPDQDREAQAYFETQLKWFDALDHRLAERAGTEGRLPIRPFRIYGYHLKLLLDSTILQWRLWSGVLEALRPVRVTYHTDRRRTPRPDWQLIQTDEHPHRHLIPAFCRLRGIPCAVRRLEVDRRSSSFAANHPLRHLAGRALAKAPLIRGLVEAVRDGRRPAGPRSRADRPRTFLLLAEGWGLDEFAEDAWRRGHRVLAVDGTDLREFDGSGMRPLAPLSTFGDVVGAGVPPGWDEASRELLWSPLYAEWIAEQGGPEVAAYLLPRVQYFLETVCPTLLDAASTFRRVYTKYRVDAAITHSQARPWQCAAMSVAAAAPGIAAVQITHGYDPLEYARELTELPCNLYVTLDREYAAYFRGALNGRPGWDPVTVLHHPVWLGRYGGLPERGGGRLRVVFVPTFLSGDVRRVGEPTYPATWYYRFQAEMAQYFASRPEVAFVWKAPEAELVYNPMRDRIAALGARNVVFRNGRLLDEYRQADRVICDNPSTPMIEALAMGLPTLVLAHDSFAVRPGAREKFGRILQPFATPDEAKAATGRFLAEDPAGYRVPVVEEAPHRLVELFTRAMADQGAPAPAEA